MLVQNSITVGSCKHLNGTGLKHGLCRRLLDHGTMRSGLDEAAQALCCMPACQLTHSRGAVHVIIPPAQAHLHHHFPAGCTGQLQAAAGW